MDCYTVVHNYALGVHRHDAYKRCLQPRHLCTAPDVKKKEEKKKKDTNEVLELPDSCVCLSGKKLKSFFLLAFRQVLLFWQ